MNKELIINSLAEIVKQAQSGEGTGHDWWHTLRVWKMSKRLAENEKADLFVVELAALLHDIADFKFTKNEDEGSKVSQQLLTDMGVDEITIAHVCEIVDNVSFKGIKEKNKIKTIEGKIVQDADRLDAIGAMGIARCFAYGGKVGREIFNPKVKPSLNMDLATYRKHKGPSMNHFYEKHLLLKDLLHTRTARQIAEKRHKFTEDFIKQFMVEWNGED